MNGKRINVAELRSKLGISQAALARHIWGKHVVDDEMLLRKRTIRRWENDGVTPGPMIQQKLKELLDSATSDKAQESDVVGPAPKSGPQRKQFSGILPSIGSD